MTSARSGGGDIGRTMELLWKGHEHTGRGPRPSLTLEQIVVTGIRIADDEGLNALSMRRIAAELGVGAMSLYRYVPGKAELLDLMIDHVQRAEPPHPSRGADAHWRAALVAIARNTWQLAMDHPWLLQVNQARPVLGPNSLAELETSLTALSGLGLSSREKVLIIRTLDYYVAGHARAHLLQEQAAEESDLTEEEFWRMVSPTVETAMATGRYPEVADLDQHAFDIDGLEAMRFGLTALLDGLAQFVDSRTATAGDSASEERDPDRRDTPVE